MAAAKTLRVMSPVTWLVLPIRWLNFVKYPLRSCFRLPGGRQWRFCLVLRWALDFILPFLVFVSTIYPLLILFWEHDKKGRFIFFLRFFHTDSVATSAPGDDWSVVDWSQCAGWLLCALRAVWLPTPTAGALSRFVLVFGREHGRHCVG